MTRRVYLLMALAILGTVLSHAAGVGQMALSGRFDCYWPAAGFSAVGIPGAVRYFVLLAVRQLMVWCVPAFLFVSGYFVAYAARGRSGLSWKTVGSRIVNLLVPYLVWSVVGFVWDMLFGKTYTPGEYLRRLVAGEATGGYFYVLVLCQFYLLAPLLAPIAQRRGSLLLAVSGLIQLTAIGLRYLVVLRPGILPLRTSLVSPSALFIWWWFYFPAGIVCGLHIKTFSQWLARNKCGISVITIILALVALVEPEIIYRISQFDYRQVPVTLSTSLYSVAFVMCFLASGAVPTTLSKAVNQVGKRTYGIYLLHIRINALSISAIGRVVPWMFAYPILLVTPIVWVVGLSASLLGMSLVSNSPARRAYPYLFG